MLNNIANGSAIIVLIRFIIETGILNGPITLPFLSLEMSDSISKVLKEQFSVCGISLSRFSPTFAK